MIYMGIILKQTDNRTKYQEKLAAELTERAKKKSLELETPDGVDDSNYIKNTRKTDSRGVVNIIFFAVGLALIVLLMTLITK